MLLDQNWTFCSVSKRWPPLRFTPASMEVSARNVPERVRSPAVLVIFFDGQTCTNLRQVFNCLKCDCHWFDVWSLQMSLSHPVLHKVLCMEIAPISRQFYCKWLHATPPHVSFWPLPQMLSIAVLFFALITFSSFATWHKKDKDIRHSVWVSCILEVFKLVFLRLAVSPLRWRHFVACALNRNWRSSQEELL